MSAWAQRQLGPWQVEGGSLGGLATGLLIRELRLALDAGFVSRQAVSARHLCLSHGHMDHVGAFGSFLGMRAMARLPEALQVIVPEPCLAGMRKLCDALEDLQGDALAVELSAPPADVYSPLGPGRSVMPLEVPHRVPCQSYVFAETRSGLDPRFAEASKETLRELARKGEQLNCTRQVPQLAYVTDTSVRGLERHTLLQEVPYLICECTFWDARVSEEKALKAQHLHRAQLIEWLRGFRGQGVLLTHPSQRHQPAWLRDQARRLSDEVGCAVDVLVPRADTWKL